MISAPCPWLTSSPFSTFQLLAWLGSLNLQPVKSLPLNRVMGLPQTGRTCPLQGWRSLANPRPGSSAGAGRGACKLATHQLPLKGRVFTKTFFPLRGYEFDFSVLHLDLRQWRGMVRGSDHDNFGLALRLRNLDP